MNFKQTRDGNPEQHICLFSEKKVLISYGANMFDFITHSTASNDMAQ